MRYKVYSVLLVLLIVAVAVMTVAGVSWPWMAGGCAVLLLVLGLQIRSVRKPLNAVQNGMYLLREQDFGSRLRRTGQAADTGDIAINGCFCRPCIDHNLRNR